MPLYWHANIVACDDMGGEEAVLYSFGGSKTDGRVPDAGLIMDSAGNLYGTTSVGGAHDDGTVFEISHTGQETVLYSFGGADGKNPDAGLIMDGTGNLYGMTRLGGASDDGTVYRITGDSGRTSQMKSGACSLRLLPEPDPDRPHCVESGRRADL